MRLVPYPAKIWLNGQEWVKRQVATAGIGFVELSNGFAACDDRSALQAICDRLGPGHLNVFTQWWLSLPFGTTDRDAGYWSARCGRSRSPAPSCSTRPAPPAPSSRR